MGLLLTWRMPFFTIERDKEDSRLGIVTEFSKQKWYGRKHSFVERQKEVWILVTSYFQLIPNRARSLCMLILSKSPGTTSKERR